MSDAELALLGHLIGDGCTLPRHAIQYTTVEEDLAETVAALATQVFGDRIAPRIHREPGRNWYQVFLASADRLTHNKRNPVSEWLTELGVFGLRSHEKCVPDKIFAQSPDKIALFLRHLWATDGCIRPKKTTRGHYPAVYYATSSPQLAFAVQSLLLHLGINARNKRVSQGIKGSDQYHVIVTGQDDLQRFVAMGAVGCYKQEGLEFVQNYLETHKANTNRDIVPSRVWRMHAVPAMQEIGMTTRQMQAGIGIQYCGTGLYKQNMSRERALRLATVVESTTLETLENSDVYWDKIVEISPDGETQVYDLTVPTNSNFVSCNITTHNSIEQDSDIVMFLYRDVVYNEATENPNQADVIVAKHRNGPTDTIPLYFDASSTRFRDGTRQNIDLSAL